MVRSIRLMAGGLFALALATGAAGAARAQGTVTELPAEGFRPRPVREGTLSLSGGGQYGSFFGRSDFGKDFDQGLGLGFRVRYRTDTASALGLSFESQVYGARVASVADTAAKSLQIIVNTLDYYRYMKTRSRMPRYWVLGAGLAQVRQKDNGGDREFPGDGGVFTAGLGAERWMNRNLTLDLGLRYYGVLHRSRLSHAAQAGVALNFYTSP